MTEKKCIICRESKLDFPAEHVIPKSVGGQYTVHNVCKECNHSMNKSIDEPFKKLKSFAIYSFLFGIKGRGKKPTPPFNNEHYKIDNEDVRLKMNDEGFLESTISPNFPKIRDIDLSKGFCIQLDSKEIHLLDGFLDKVAKHFNCDRQLLKMESKEVIHRDEKQILISEPHNPTIFEYTKILYETACDLFKGEYIFDQTALLYADMLRKGILDKKLKHLFSPNLKGTNQIFLEMVTNSNNEKAKNSHIIFLVGHVGLGLVGFVKIFDLYHVQILSTDKKFESMNLKLVVNDFQQTKLFIYEPVNRPKNCSVNVDRELVLNSDLIKGLNVHKFNSNDKIYSSKGDVVASNVFDLVSKSRHYRRLDTDFQTRLNYTFWYNNDYFLKRENKGIQIPIKSVIYHYDLIKIKKR